VLLGVMAGRPRQRESAGPCRLDRRAGCEQRRFVRRLGAERVAVEEASRTPYLLDEVGCVTAQKVGFGRRYAFDEREALVQRCDALLRLRMPARRMQTDERGVAYELRCRSSRIC
jgi:hypothetical protein